MQKTEPKKPGMDSRAFFETDYSSAKYLMVRTIWLV